MRAWNVPELVNLITHDYPDFPTKKELILKIGTVLADFIPAASLNQNKVTREH